MTGPARRGRADPKDTPPPSLPQSTPSVGAGAGGDFTQFVWQQLSEIQRTQGDILRTLGAIEQQGVNNADQFKALCTSIDKVTERVNSHGTWIKSVTAVGVVVGAISAWLFSEIWSVAKPVILEKFNPPQPASAQPAQSATPAQKK